MKTSSRKRDTKNIHKKGDVYYVVKMIQGKRTWFKIGSNLDQAIQERNRIETLLVTKQFDIVKNAIGKEKISGLTLEQAINDYIENRLKYKKSGKKLISNLSRLKKEHGSLQISNVSFEVMERFQNMRLSEVKKATVRNEISVIKTMFKYYVNKQIISENPCNCLDKIKFNNTRDRIAPHEDFMKLLSAEWQYKNGDEEKNCRIQPHVILSLIIADHTAMRLSEILNLKWSDIRNVTGGKCFYVTGFNEKTKNNESRLVPIHTELEKILEIQNRNSLYIVNFKGKNIKSIKTALNKAKEKTGLLNDRFHDLRHRAITRFVQEGYSIPIIQQVSGHLSDSAFKRYVNLKQNDLSVFFGYGNKFVIPRITLEDYLKVTGKCRTNVER